MVAVVAVAVGYRKFLDIFHRLQIAVPTPQRARVFRSTYKYVRTHASGAGSRGTAESQ